MATKSIKNEPSFKKLTETSQKIIESHFLRYEGGKQIFKTDRLWPLHIAFLEQFDYVILTGK